MSLKQTLNEVLVPNLTPVFGDERPELVDHEISCAYIVKDQHGRRMGWVVRASYSNEKRQSWFAIGNDARVSMWLIERRAEAIETLDLMYRAYLCTMTMDPAILPGTKPKQQPIEMLTLVQEA